MFLASIALALVPVFNFALQHYFSKKDDLLNLSKKHWTTYWGDFVFVIFNFLFLYSVTINTAAVLSLIILSTIANIIIHILFIKLYNNPECIYYMITRNHSNLTRAGWVHFAFSTFQTFLILLAFFSSMVFPQFYLLYFSIYLVSVIFSYGSKKIHGKIMWYDFLVSICLIVAFSIKIFVGF